MILPAISQKCREENESSQSLISAFSPCSFCGAGKMASVPMGAFAAFKVREQINCSQSDDKQQGGGSSSQGPTSAKMSLTNNDCPDIPTKYSSKAMMAIWGMYNRYSVHNFKSNVNSYDNKA